jgi:thioredoxin reductase (NADPH)
MIDLEWDRRSHDLRDALTVNGVSFAFHTKDSDSGRQLIRNHRVDGTRLPALIRHDGTVLQQPSMGRNTSSGGHPAEHLLHNRAGRKK